MPLRDPFPVAPAIAEDYRVVLVQHLRYRLDRAYTEHREGRQTWLGALPEGRSDRDVVLIAFVGWASASADDDVIGAVIDPKTFKLSCGTDDPSARGRLLGKVRDLRRQYEAWRAGRPLRAWQLTGGLKPEPD